MRKAQTDSKAKTKLLDAAQKLMMERGYAATSLEDICKSAKLTKGSFFHYFKSKEDLGKALLQRFCHFSQEQMQECCSCEKSPDPLKRVYQHIDFAVAMSKDPVAGKGCLLGKLAQELCDTHPEIRSLCAEGFLGWAKLFKRDLDAAKARYAPRASFDTQSLAEYFIALSEGSQILARVKRDRKIIEKNMEHFRSYIKTLFNR